MKLIAVKIVVASLMLSATPAFAAPPEIEDFCFPQAAQIWFNGRGDREHFIANCIADLTPPKKQRPYKKRGY